MLFLLLLPPQQLLQQHMLLHSQGGALQKLSIHSTLTSAGDGKEKTAQQVLAFPLCLGIPGPSSDAERSGESYTVTGKEAPR